MTVTLNKGGTGEKVVKLEHLEIPDLWNLALSLPEPQKRAILETWHLAHDLKRELLESEFPGILRDVLRYCVTVDGMPDKHKGRSVAQQNAFDDARRVLAKWEGQQ